MSMHVKECEMGLILTVAATRFKINYLAFSVPLDWGAWGREFESRRPDQYHL